MRTIVIDAVCNGYTVKVGCRTVVFNDDQSLIRELTRYLIDPKSVEEEYLKKERHSNSPTKLETNAQTRENIQTSFGVPSAPFSGLSAALQPTGCC